MSQTRFVLFNHSSVDAAFNAALCAELTKRGFTVVETSDSKVALQMIETRHDLGFLLTDEENLNISGTSVVQRVESRGYGVPTAVLAYKDIPPRRVPVAFKKPVAPEKIAQYVTEKFAVPAAGTPTPQKKVA